MADSMDMATLAFGARRGTRVAGRVLRGLRGAKVTRATRAKRRRKAKFKVGRGSRGIRLSNEFVKTFILVNMIRGMHT